MNFLSSFPRRRESSNEKIIRVADKTLMLLRCAGTALSGWIPACAGMTAREVAA